MSEYTDEQQESINEIGLMFLDDAKGICKPCGEKYYDEHSRICFHMKNQETGIEWKVAFNVFECKPNESIIGDS